MKFIYLFAVLSLSIPAFAAEPFSRPTEKCLANISAAMKVLGTSKIEIENEIDFEGFLDVNQNHYTFMYYKTLAAGAPRNLDISGKGSIDLEITQALEFQGLTDISDCNVSNAKILEEVVD